MRSLFTSLVCVAALLTIASYGNACLARGRCQLPTFPTDGHAAHHGPVSHGGQVYLVPTPAYGGYVTPAPKAAYAYGWFGAKRRRHKNVHYGYYNHRTDWSHR